MSIAIIGPERYQYQDLAILELILRFWQQEVECIVEPVGGEDATLNMKVRDVSTDIEVQVKGAEATTAALDMEQLAEYLSHFPPRSDKNPLLERLLINKTCEVVLICAQRATDECAALVVLRKWQGKHHANSPELRSVAEGLLERLWQQNSSGNGELNDRRIEAMHLLANHTNLADLRNALCRLIVLDNWDRDLIVDSIERYLRKDHHVAGDALQDVINRLLQKLQDAKVTQINIIPDIREVLRAATTPSVRPCSYVRRGQEQTWRDRLSTDRVLLLSGPPRCGKSETARWVAAEFETKGFATRLSHSVEDAERIILNGDPSEVVVILDDPLGSGIESDRQSPRALQVLQRLLRKIPMNRRLVVAQSQEVLLATTGADSLLAVETAGKSWNDLSMYPENFLKNVWTDCVSMYQVPPYIADLVTQGIASEALKLVPGSLSHLAAHHTKLTSEVNFDDIHRLATQSAQDFAGLLCTSQVSTEVVRALAVGSSEHEAIPERELAFILGAGGNPKLPRFPGVMYVGGRDQSPTLPNYDDEPLLTGTAKAEVAKLQRHRVLVDDDNNHLRFSHPFYVAAARAVVNRLTSIERGDIINLISRSLLSLSPNSSAAAARNLWWLYRDLGSRMKLGDAIVEAAEKGLRWYFLATRDLCYTFLLRVAETSPAKYRNKLSSWVSSARSIGIDDLVWNDDGVHFFPEGLEQPLLAPLLAETEVPSSEQVSKKVGAIRYGKSLPGTHETIDVLKYFRAYPSKMESTSMRRLLSYDAGPMRGAAAAAWVSLERESDNEILERLSRDTHPRVIYESVKSILRSWSRYSYKRQCAMLKLIEVWCEQPETAAVALQQLISHFYQDDEEKHWDLFAGLFPKMADHFPVSFWLPKEQLYTVCSDALQQLPAGSALNVALAWAKMLESAVDKGKLPDDFELGVCDTVIESPSLQGEARMSVLRRLLEIPSTGCVIVFIAELTAAWDQLTPDDKGLVKEFLVQGRPDSDWLRAAALTRKVVPKELQELILGDSQILDGGSSEVISRLPPGLLKACILLYTGDPQPLWYLGKHHSSSTVWKKVVRLLASMPEHELFEQCLMELIQFDDHALCDVISQLQYDVQELVFNFLVDKKVKVIEKRHRDAIDLLLNTAPDEDVRKRMQERMASRALAVLENVTDISCWTSHRDTQKVLLGVVPNDWFVRRSIIKINGMNESENRLDSFNTLIEVTKNKAPLLFGTYSELQLIAKEVGVAGDVLEYLEYSRQHALQVHRNAEDKFAFVPPQKHLEGWHGPG